MRNLDKKRQRFAWLLLLVYLPMVLAISFHHHTEVEDTSAISYCYDCTHHIHHGGHLSTTHPHTQECVLCQLHNVVYLVPSIVKVAIPVAILIVALTALCLSLKAHECGTNTVRAPPSILSL